MPDKSVDQSCPTAVSGAGATLRIAPRSNFRSRFTAVAPSAAGEQAMSPAQALVYLQRLSLEGKALQLICLAGPGEPMAEPALVLATVAQVHAAYPQAVIGLNTIGLGLAEHAADLAAQGLKRVTLQVSAVELAVAREVYAWVRPGKRTLAGDEGLELLLSAQADSLRACVAAGLEVIVETLLIPGVNEGHMAAIASWASSGGAVGMRVQPAAYKEEEALSVPAPMLAAAQQAVAGVISLLQPEDCCDVNTTHLEAMAASGPTAERPCVAVATTDGATVNEHLGYAAKFLIYKAEGGHGRMLGVREAPPRGGGEGRWQALAQTLSDCFMLLVSDAGDNPRRVLTEAGLEVRNQPEVAIEDAVATALGLAKKKR